MWTALQRLRLAWQRPAPAAVAAPLVEPVTADPHPPGPPPEAPPPPDPALDQRFVGQLLRAGAWHEAEPSPAERELLHRLAGLVAQPQSTPLVPRRPTALPRLLGLLQDERSSARALAELVAQDPALLGEVMRLAHSAAYRGERRLDSLEQAVMMLGEQGLRQLVTRALMTPVYSPDRGRYAPRASPRLWAEALRSAHGCAWLSRHHETRFEAYLAGMVVDTGLIATLRLMDQAFPADAEAASLGFLQRLLPLSAHWSVGIARQWELPEPVVAAVAAHAESCAAPYPVPTAGLGADLRTAVRCARRLLLQGAGQPAERAWPAADTACLHELARAFPATAAG